MRLDKFLKLSRLIKRRTIANEICAAGRVFLNGKVAKPGSKVEVGDQITIIFGQGNTVVRVKNTKPVVRKDEASFLYEIVEV